MSPAPDFVPFGAIHAVATALIALASVAIPLASRRLGPAGRARVAGGVAVAMLVLEVLKLGWRVAVTGVPVHRTLPLHLCDVSTFLVAYLLFTRSHGAFQVAYFWGMAGSVVAILTPDLDHGFPHLYFFTFFFGHGLVVLGVLYATLVFGFRPTLRSVRIAVTVTLGYAALIAPVNWLLGTNYLYLCRKPGHPSLLDVMGPWPWYLVGLGVVLVAACLVCWLPFGLLERARRRQAAAPAPH